MTLTGQPLDPAYRQAGHPSPQRDWVVIDMAARKRDRQPFSEILELRIFKLLVDDPGTQISIISIMLMLLF